MKRSKQPVKATSLSFLATKGRCQHFMPPEECPHCREQVDGTHSHLYVVLIDDVEVFRGCRKDLITFFKTEFEELCDGATYYERKEVVA